MEKYIKNDQVLDVIKEVIYELYPVKRPRVEYDDYTYRYKNEELGIIFYFYNVEEGEICAQICFLKQNNFMFKYYLVDKDSSDEIIANLIRFLLKEFPYVNSLGESANGFSLDFGVGLEHHDMEGISCNKVQLSFETHPDLYEQFYSLLNDYFEYIMYVLSVEIGNNSEYNRGYYGGYYDTLKSRMVNDFNSEELKQYIGLLTDDEMRSVLFSMGNGRFFEMANTLKQDYEVSRGKAKELKKSLSYKK